MSDLGEPGASPEREPIGWPRAIASGLAVLVAGFLLTVYAANAILTHFGGLARNTRQYLASILFVVVVVLMAWALRRLQARGLI